MYSPTQRDENSDRSIRCLVVHEHVLLRQGLLRLLADEPDIEVVAEAGSASEALQRLRDLHPDVVIAASNIFEDQPEQVGRLIQQESPRSKILFFAPDTSADELVETVRVAHRSGIAVQEVTRDLVREMPRFEAREWPAEEMLPRKRVLTMREREVLKLLAEGRTVRSTADVLGLSAKTVDAHKFNLMRKLGVHNKAELVMWAIQKKVVKLPVN